MRALLKISDGLAAGVSGIGKLAALLSLPMMIVILLDIVSRKLTSIFPDITRSMFHISSTKLQETEWHLHAVLFLLCLGFAYIKDRHVRIELVRDHLSPRIRTWIELLGCLLFLLPYCYLVISFGVDFALRSYNSGEVSAALTGLPHRWVIKSFLVIGFSVLALAAVSVALRCIVTLFGPRELTATTERSR